MKAYVSIKAVVDDCSATSAGSILKSIVEHGLGPEGSVEIEGIAVVPAKDEE